VAAVRRGGEVEGKGQRGRWRCVAQDHLKWNSSDVKGFADSRRGRRNPMDERSSAPARTACRE
jgi:hypothetical protein